MTGRCFYQKTATLLHLIMEETGGETGWYYQSGRGAGIRLIDTR